VYKLGVELKQLRYFVAVAEELSFSRAAQRLHMTQPPLSAQVKHLEEEIGVLLLERSTRNVRLTEAGYLFLEETRRFLAQLEQTDRMVRRVGQGEVGRLALGFVPSASNSALPPLLRVFRESFPDVELSLHEMNPRQLVHALHDKRIDAAFFYLPFDGSPPFGDASLNSRPVLREPLVAALPEGHPLATGREVEVRALVDDLFVLPAPYQGSGLRDRVIDLCRQAGFVPKVVQEAHLMQTVVGLVASGIGVALVPASLQKLQTTGVVCKPLRGLTPTVEMGIVWRRDDPGAVLGSFLKLVAELFRSDRAIREGQ